MTTASVLCVCDKLTENLTLQHIIKSLRTVLLALETKARQEDADADKFQTLDFKLREASAQTVLLEKEKSLAQRRSDLYKQRFLDAQETIKLLHEKNVQLSSSQKQAEPPSRFLFKSPLPPVTSNDEAADDVILAPDTCGFDLLGEKAVCDITTINSDEEDFREPPEKKTPKSAKSDVGTKRNTIDHYFATPKSPIGKVKFDKTKSVVDLDQTRLDDDSVNVSAALTDSELDTIINQDCSEMDSIPPSPVLSGESRHQLQMMNAKWLTGNGSYTRKSSDSAFVDLDETVLDKEVDTEQTGKAVCGKKDQQPAGSKATSHEINTSLDEIFERTYGELETTSIVDLTKVDESDDELSYLLLDNATSSETFLTPNEIPPPRRPLKKRRTNAQFEDSYDVLPKREIVHEPNETVRKKDEREKLEGRACPQCAAYYRDCPAGERKEMLKKLCRHKLVNSPPSTPDHFWEVEIPSTAECRRRGYITDGPGKAVGPERSFQSSRRKRPLRALGGDSVKKSGFGS